MIHLFWGISVSKFLILGVLGGCVFKKPVLSHNLITYMAICDSFIFTCFQSLQQGDQVRNSPNTPTTTPASSSSMASRNQNHNTEHSPTTASQNNHHPHIGPNTGSHRFHPYSRQDGNIPAKVDASRDPRLKLREKSSGNNGNGNGASFISSTTNGNNGHPNTDMSPRNVINTSRDPRTRR